MAWIILIAAGICEICWAILMKASHGFTRLWPTVGTLFFLILSMVLLMFAMKRLPLGTSYTVWTGIGAVGTVIWGMLMLNEPHDWPRVACIVMIVAGIIGLKALSPAAGG
jgi:quaternary ammonium compound-resistance protein SugE